MPNKTHQDIEQDKDLWLLYRCYRSRFGKQCMQTLYVWNSAFDPNCKLCQQPSFVRLSLGTAMPYSSLNSSSVFFIHMILYNRKLGCEHAIATCPMALGESLTICHDLRGLLALGKGDLWSWLSPWVLQWYVAEPGTPGPFWGVFGESPFLSGSGPLGSKGATTCRKLRCLCRGLLGKTIPGPNQLGLMTSSVHQADELAVLRDNSSAFFSSSCDSRRLV